MANGEPRGWRAVASEMLSAGAVGAQVSRAEAWQRACKEIVSLRSASLTVTDYETTIEAMYRAEGEACSSNERHDIIKVREKIQVMLRRKEYGS